MTSAQMKMFQTRLGEDSRMVVTGDPSQSDLPGGRADGLNEALAHPFGRGRLGRGAFYGKGRGPPRPRHPHRRRL
ncbi:MAG: PhoH family protein [Rhizomicrobium sp.]